MKAEPGQTHGCPSEGHAFFALVPAYWDNPWAWGQRDLLRGGQGVSALSEKGQSATCLRRPCWTSWWTGQLSESDLSIQGGPWVVLCTWTGTPRKPVAPGVATEHATWLPGRLKDVAFLQGHFALGLKLGDDAHHQIQIEMETK